jgi:hypothetical protein
MEHRFAKLELTCFYQEMSAIEIGFVASRSDEKLAGYVNKS